MEGASEAVWDKESNTLKLSLASNVDVKDVHNLIASVGHDTDEVKAKDDVYNTLPGCCHYREVEKH